MATEAAEATQAPSIEQVTTAAPQKKFNLDDCKQHTKEQDCWIVLSGKVYDVSEFLDEHPGGFDIVLAATGTVFQSL
jgi:cytochrome b involved in lipid metabolism